MTADLPYRSEIDASGFLHATEQALRENGWFLAEQGGPLRADLQLLTQDVRTLETAGLSRPAVGIVSLEAGVRAALAPHIAIGGSGMPVGEIADVVLNYRREIAFSDEPFGHTAVLRLSTSGSIRSPEFPVQVSLLGEADILAIVASMGLADATSEAPIAGAVDAVHAACARALTARDPYQGKHLLAVDVLGLRRDLERRFRGHPRLALLDSTAFWEILGTTVEHLRGEARAALLAQIWGGNPELTDLYERLQASLERLSSAETIDCPLDAVVSFDLNNMPRADRSILDARRLRGLLDGRADPVIACLPNGRQFSMDRAEISALAREVDVRVTTTEGGTTAPGYDVLDFPPLPLDLPVADAAVLALEERFAREKSQRLLQSYVRAQVITSLVTTVSTSRLAPASDAGPIADWVQWSQGQRPVDRERTEPGLFIAATGRAADFVRLFEGFEQDPVEAKQTPDRRSGSQKSRSRNAAKGRLTAMVSTVLADLPEAAVRWSADAAFSNMVLYRVAAAPGRITSGSGAVAAPQDAIFDRSRDGRELGLNVHQAASWQRAAAQFFAQEGERAHCMDPLTLWSSLSEPNDGGANYLARRLASVTQVRDKRRQVGRRLAQEVASFAGTLQRHVVTDDILAAVDLPRKEASHQVTQRLRSLAQDDGLGSLLDVLRVRDDDIARLLRTVDARHVQDAGIFSLRGNAGRRTTGASGQAVLRPDPGGMVLDLTPDDPEAHDETVAAARDYASAAMRLWVRHLRQLAQRRDVHGALQLSQPVFAALVEELIAGFRLRDVKTRMTDELRVILGTETGRAYRVEAATSSICDKAGRYLMWLGFEDAWLSNYPLRPGARSQAIFPPSSADSEQQFANMPGLRRQAFQLDWITAFAALVDENERALVARIGGGSAGSPGAPHRPTTIGPSNGMDA